NHLSTVVSAREPEDIGKPYLDFSISLDPPPTEVTMLPKSLTEGPDTPPEDRVFGFVAPMRYGNVHLGVLILTLSRRPIEQAQQRAVLLATLFAVATALAISVGAVVVTRRELRVVGAMQNALTAQAQGHFDQRVQTDRKDELGDLARAFNTMSDQAE